MRVAGYPMLESYGLVLDTLVEAKNLIVGLERYTLDSLYEHYLNETGAAPIERPFHDARTDSEILAEVLGYLLKISGK